jgi:hypothetical protein
MTPTPPELRADDFRPYALPDSLDTTVHARCVPGEPGIYWSPEASWPRPAPSCWAGRSASACSTTRTPSSSTVRGNA